MSDGCVTVAHCVEGLPMGCFIWEVLLCAFLASFLLGAINESSPFTFGLVATDWGVTERNVQLSSAALACGTFFSVLVGGFMADRHGRASVLKTSILLTISCSVILQMTRTLYQALFARLLLGLASGATLAVLMPLVAELLPSKKRGFYLTIWCCGQPAGALFALMVSCAVSRIDWTTFITFIMAPGLILYVLCKLELIPESPRHLYLVGKRDEGYNTLLDMYEKEMLPFAWAPDSIAVTVAPPRSSSSSEGSKSSLKSVITSDVAVTAGLCVVMFFVCAASQCIKIWMPLAIASSDYAKDAALLEVDKADLTNALLSFSRVPVPLGTADHRLVMAVAQGYMVELLGVVVCAFISTVLSRKRLVQVALFSAALFTFLTAVAQQRGFLILAATLFGMHLVSQAAAINFILVFTCEKFPTSCRAWTVGLVLFFGEFGRVLMPAFGALLLDSSEVKAVVFFTGMYLTAWLISFQLPLTSNRERPLHDVEDSGSKTPLARSRKRSVTYQTV